MMKKIVTLCIGFLLRTGVVIAQKAEEANAHSDMVFTKPDAFTANLIIWISVAIVVATLIVTLKYLFFPGEKDPNHIKYIVKDERFE